MKEGKKKKKIKDNGFPGFSSYMETLSTACQIHITGPILSTLLPWHIYLERWWKYGVWRVFEPLRRKRKICLRPSKADNSVTAVEELLCQKRQEQCCTVQPTTAAEQPGGMWERQDWGTVRGLGNTKLGFFFHFLSQANWSCLTETEPLSRLAAGLNSQTKSIIS